MNVAMLCCHVERCGFAARCCDMHCSGCMDAALGGSWGTKRKVAAADDARYLVCAAGAGRAFWCFFVPDVLLLLQAAVAAVVCAHL